MFRRKEFYYGAIVLDLFFRFTWTFTLVSSGYVNPGIKNTAVMLPIGPNVPANLLELFRRTFWSILRIENEHLNNTERYRAVDFVPLYFSEEDREEEDPAALEAAKDPTVQSLEKRRGYFAALRIIVLVFAVISLASWTLHMDDDRLEKNN
jgi:hypothetical protein